MIVKIVIVLWSQSCCPSSFGDLRSREQERVRVGADYLTAKTPDQSLNSGVECTCPSHILGGGSLGRKIGEIKAQIIQMMVWAFL